MSDRAQVEAMLYLLREAFDGNREHSIMGNLGTVTEDDFDWVPPGGVRSIRQIAVHAGAAKYAYGENAFGATTPSWSESLVVRDRDGAEADGSYESVVEWLREGHRQFRERVSALVDSEMDRPRITHWGAMYDTRRIIASVIEHDLYHAGEINHIRALRQGNDSWAGE